MLGHSALSEAPLSALPEAGGGTSVTVTPGAGSLTLTGYAPTVTATSNATASPGAGSLTLTGFAPTVSVTRSPTVAPGTGSLAITGYAPTVSTGEQLRGRLIRSSRRRRDFTEFGPEEIPPVESDKPASLPPAEPTTESRLKAALDIEILRLAQTIDVVRSAPSRVAYSPSRLRQLEDLERRLEERRIQEIARAEARRIAIEHAEAEAKARRIAAERAEAEARRQEEKRRQEEEILIAKADEKRRAEVKKALAGIMKMVEEAEREDALEADINENPGRYIRQILDRLDKISAKLDKMTIRAK